MKKIFVVIVLSGLGYYLFSYKTNPTDIVDPYYAEARVELQIQDRELTMVLMGKMVDITDCEKRGQRFWRNMLEDCDTCKFVDYQCKTELSNRYKLLFSNRPTYTTYVAADRGTRFERDARMIVWGLTKNESMKFCGYIIKAMNKKYNGQVRCIEGSS